MNGITESYTKIPISNQGFVVKAKTIILGCLFFMNGSNMLVFVSIVLDCIELCFCKLPSDPVVYST